MPSVAKDPDKFLLDVISDLQSRVLALETRSKPNYAGFQVLSSSQVLIAGVNTIDLTSTNIDTGGIVDLAGNKVTLPWDGYYLVTMKIPPASPTGATDSLIWSVTRSAYIGGMNTLMTVEQCYADYIYVQKNEVLQLRAVPGAGTTVGGYRWGMTYHRAKV